MTSKLHRIKLTQPSHGFYHDYTKNFKLTKGKILFQRDPVSDVEGALYVPDVVKERRKSLWGAVVDSNDEWVRPNDRVIIRRTAVVMPATPDREMLFVDVKDVLARMRDIKTLSDIEPRKGYLVLKMERDTTHVGSLELPDNMKRNANIGEVLSASTDRAKVGDRVIVDPEMGLWIYNDIEGIKFDFRLNIVTEEAIFGIIESD